LSEAVGVKVVASCYGRVFEDLVVAYSGIFLDADDAVGFEVSDGDGGFSVGFEEILEDVDFA